MIEKDEQALNKVGDEYITTRQAAEKLGLSLGTVQQMVESGTLAAWKTDGGHRRVSMASVNEHLARRSGMASLPRTRSSEFSVLIAEDDTNLQTLYRMTLASWNLPITINIVDNGYEGLVQIGLQAPAVLILDLSMPKIDGFEMIRTLRANPALSTMDIIVVTGMSPDIIEQRGGLPLGTTIFGKPIPFHQLQGYLQAKLAQHQRSMTGSSS
jgi:excisionase family DNA binding protein